MPIFARLLLPLVALFGLCRALPAQTGTSLLKGDSFGCFTTMDGSPANASASPVAVDGPGFTKAWDLRTINAGTNPWDVRLRCFNTQPTVKNDVIVATFWMRTIAMGQGQAQGTSTFVFERDNYDKDASFTASAGSEWQRFDVVFQASNNYTGTSQSPNYNLSFWVNYAGQEVQIGGFTILDYGPNFDATTLNLPPPWPYIGHDPNAQWRREALDRIERVRKADVALVIRDDAGKPLAGVPVHLQMKQHAFGWGTAVDSRTLSSNPIYAKAINDNFNKIVLENDLKWPPFEDPSWSVDGKKSADYGLNWASDNGFSMVRGHNIIWPGLTNLPTDVQNLLKASPVDKTALSKRIDDHIQEVVTFAKGRVSEWDVINEPFWNHDVQAVLGKEAMAHWFDLARKYDPDVKLYLNDACIGEACGVDQQHIDFTSNVLKGLVDAGAPIDALGLQSHFDSNLTPPERALHYFDYWANSFKPGLQLQVTEFDVNIPMESVQADYTRDYMIAAFSHPAMTGFMMWGFWEGQHWLPRGAMLHKDWSEKPNFKVWRDLVYKQWWTDVTGTTTSDGAFQTRAFLGEYDLSYTLNGVTTTVPFSVTGGQLNYKMVGPAPATPQFDASRITNAASHLQGPVAPGEMVIISGTGIGLASPQEAGFDDQHKLPTALALTRVLFDGTPANLLAVIPGQVIAVVPPTALSATSVVVETLNVQSGAISVPVVAASPALFTCYGDAGTPLMFAQSGPPVLSCDQGAAVAAAGQTVVFYATGMGSGASQVLFDGKPAPACPAAAISQPSPGIWEVDTCIPSGAAAGSVEVRIQSGAIQSPPTHVQVR